MSEHNGSINITWVDGHRSSYNRANLLHREALSADHIRSVHLPQYDWPSKIPFVSFNSPSADWQTTLATNLRMYGICMITDVGATPEASEVVMRMIGPIKNTHFGASQIVQADLSSNDTAYTRSALDQHTDTTYYTLPIHVLGLHLLSHNGIGGESVLVDGFRAAARLAEAEAQAYHTLASVGIYHHASGNQVSVQPDQSFPVLEHDRSGRLTRLRYNNADRAEVTGTYQQIDAWYKASTKFARIINNPSHQLRLKLQPGSMLLLDNWRVLHGRNSYDGDRRLFTAYVDHDEYMAYLKRHLYTTEQLAQTYDAT